MNVLDAIRERHSIRSFTDETVSRETLRDLTECAVLAPTASNVQCWKFIAVTDPDFVRKITLFSPGLSGKPPVILALCTDQSIAESRLGETNSRELATIDVSLAAENIMLRAVEQGLGTCAIKSFNEEAVRAILGLPSHIRLEYLLALGYPAGPGKSPARKAIEEVLYYDTYKE